MDTEAKKKVQDIFNLDFEAITEHIVETYSFLAKDRETFCRAFTKVMSTANFTEAAKKLFPEELSDGVFHLGNLMDTVGYIYRSAGFLSRIPFQFGFGLYFVRYRFRCNTPGVELPPWKYLVTACNAPDRLFISSEVSAEFTDLSVSEHNTFEGMETEIFRINDLEEFTEILESVCKAELYDKETGKFNADKAFGHRFTSEEHKDFSKMFTSSRDLPAFRVGVSYAEQAAVR